MADDESPNEPDPHESDSTPGQVHYAPVTARVPAHVRRGVFSTHAVVLEGADECLLDFLLRMAQPQQLVARIVLTKSVVGRFIVALRENLNIYRNTFGEIPSVPRPRAQAGVEAEPETVVSLTDLYTEMKTPEEVLSGVYANAVMISHSPTEFCFDFITNFYPQSVVAARVFMAGGQVPGLLGALVQCHERSRGTPPPESPEEAD